jgi:hypothetical protein
MRPRSVIFILLQLPLSFVAAARLIWNAGDEPGNVQKGLLVNKVELIGDHKESEPFPENDAWLRVMSMRFRESTIEQRFCNVDRARSVAGFLRLRAKCLFRNCNGCKPEIVRRARAERVLPAEKRFSSLILDINGEVRDASTCAASRPHAIGQKPLRHRRPSNPFQSFNRHAPYCCVAAINPADRWDTFPSFVVSKLTSINRRATLFHTGD